MFDVDKLETALQKLMKAIADSNDENLKKDAKDFLETFIDFLAPFKLFDTELELAPEKWDVTFKNERTEGRK